VAAAPDRQPVAGPRLDRCRCAPPAGRSDPLAVGTAVPIGNSSASGGQGCRTTPGQRTPGAPPRRPTVARLPGPPA
jgi:hypothetical protein